NRPERRAVLRARYRVFGVNIAKSQEAPDIVLDVAVMSADWTDDRFDPCSNVIGPPGGMDKQCLKQGRPLNVGQARKIRIRRL
ncbi:hypothetical protein, partial [Erythrobacter donghaensis]|uniref:hypothetical protein n=1 Tax=Erythrobacter donghaensis TaxID=267135 RepID=UPI0018C579B6